MRIGIVNDLKLALEILSRVIKHEHEIAWTAMDGQEAIDRCLKDRPDLVLMDLIMPGVDGVAATAEIMRLCPCPVLVVTATVEGNVSRVFEAMSAGALDAVNTPAIENGELIGGQELLKKVSNIARITGKKPAFTTTILSSLPPVVLIGASTGGPAVLSELLSQLPADFPAAVIIAQHVDATFIDDFCRWLTRHCKMPCAVCKKGDAVMPGRVYIARSDSHLFLNGSARLDYTSYPADYPHLPGINILFESFARNWPQPGAALLLTGMGEDGAAGLLELKNANWHTIAQNEATCVVYGMPKAAVRMNAAKLVLPTDDIAPNLIEFFRRQSR